MLVAESNVERVHAGSPRSIHTHTFRLCPCTHNRKADQVFGVFNMILQRMKRKDDIRKADIDDDTGTSF